MLYQLLDQQYLSLKAEKCQFVSTGQLLCVQMLQPQNWQPSCNAVTLQLTKQQIEAPICQTAAFITLTVLDEHSFATCSFLSLAMLGVLNICRRSGGTYNSLRAWAHSKKKLKKKKTLNINNPSKLKMN